MGLHLLPAVLNSRLSWFHCCSLDSVHSVAFRDALVLPLGLHIWVFRFVQVFGVCRMSSSGWLTHTPHTPTPCHISTPSMLTRPRSCTEIAGGGSWSGMMSY
jgi:hypothetical protein